MRPFLILGKGYAPLLQKPLEARGVSVIWLEPYSHVDPRVKDHADLILQPIGNGEWIAAPSYWNLLCYQMKLFGHQVFCGENEADFRYPQEARYDGLLLNGQLFHKEACMDESVKKKIQLGTIRWIPVCQGYTSCAVAPIGNHAAITADRGLAGILERQGIEVLRISAGGISLPGYSYGFFGGACFLLKPGVLACTGQLKHHPEYHQILDFLKRSQVQLDILTDLPAFDCGARSWMENPLI